MESIPPLNPDDMGRGPMIVGVLWAFTILAMLTVALRIYVRQKVSKFCAPEDWIMLAAVILQVVNQSIVTVSYRYGMGKHDQDLEQPTQYVNVLKWNWIASAPGMVVSILARISIAVLLVRLFGVHAWFKWFTIGLTTIQIVVCGVIIPLTWCQVQPVDGLWDVYRTDVKRWDPMALQYVMYVGQSLYTVSDVTCVLFPVIIIWRLNMPTRRKFGLVALLAGSLCTAAISILKTKVAQSSHVDAQYKASLGVLWSGLEEAIVIIMGCVPTLRSITKLDFPAFSSLRSSLSSLVRGKKIKNSSVEDGCSASGPYNDLEVNTYKLGQIGASGVPLQYVRQGPTIQRNGHGSTQDLIPTTSNHVVRTDEFTVSYNFSQQG